jgi:hypothetical protein
MVTISTIALTLQSYEFFPAECIYVFPMIPRIKRDYFCNIINQQFSVMEMQYVFGEVGKLSERFSNNYLIYRTKTRKTTRKD